jgi:hypothetical protein
MIFLTVMTIKLRLGKPKGEILCSVEQNVHSIIPLFQINRLCEILTIFSAICLLSNLQ